MLLCSRIAPSTAAEAEAADLMRAELDWDYVVESSVRHSVAPLLHNGLTRAPGADEQVPAAALAELGRLRDLNAERNSRLYGIVGEVGEALGARGVRSLGLKDLGLALELYPDPALRPIGDLDLLIAREDYEAAAECLGGLGFERLPRADNPYARKYATGHHFRRVRDEIWIDLQWNVMEREFDVHGDSPRTYDIAGMWQRARTLRYRSGDLAHELLVPGPEDLLYHLCVHAEGHRHSELILLCDIAELVAAWQQRLDWDLLVDIARQHQARGSVGATLGLVERLFGSAPPAGVPQKLATSTFAPGLSAPLFGGLTNLHYGLDDVQAAVAPPPELLERLERMVREQAASARAAYDELTSLVGEFAESGGELALFAGARPERQFPDARLGAFGEVDLVVLEKDFDGLAEAARARGFRPSEASGRLAKRVRSSSRDPLVSGQETEIALELVHDAGPLLNPPEISRSNSAVALRSLSSRVRPGAHPPEDGARLPVRVAALAREEVLLWLLTETGRREHEVLFSIELMLNFVERSRERVDAERLVEAAQRHGVEREAGIGVQMLAAVALPETWSKRPVALERLPLGRARALEWARYGAGSLERYPMLRNAYLAVLCLLAARGGKERVRVLRGARRHAGGVAAALRAGIRRRRGRKDTTPGELVHWLHVPGSDSAPWSPRESVRQAPEARSTPS